jgi:N-acetylglucosamine-6-sulfatase
VRRAMTVLFAVVIVAVGVGLPASAASARVRDGERNRPNILFVLTDDMAKSELAVMPHVRDLLADQGTSFSQAFVSVSLCCPSRTTILRGQYSHNTGVQTNGGENGGFETAHSKGVESSTIATWLHGAGYRTGLFGKYLNGYPDGAADNFVPPGWDEFDSPTRGGNPYREYNYNLNETGRIVHFGHAPADYGTDVYSHLASDFITRAGREHKPFFAYVPMYAPHNPATPPPGESGLFPGAKAPRVPSYNESDMTDKPQWLRGTPMMSPATQARVDGLYRRRIQSLQAVDASVANLVATLQRNGQLDNTYIVFASDNGYHLGEHRMPAGKQTAYDEDIHVPFIVRGPGVPDDATRDQLVGNVDWAPTFAELAGVKPPDFVDGRSLVPLLRAGPAPAHWRDAYLVEHWREIETPGQIAARQGLPIEPPDPDQSMDETAPVRGPKYHGMRGASVHDPSPEFHAIRTPKYLYVEYSTGEKELYDLDQDPYELHNIAREARPALLETLHRRVDALKVCRSETCRQAESAPS